jgi:CheY-like chemotaxis protein
VAESEGARQTRVLIVDDDAAIRATLRMLLEPEGYAVAEARDGRAALEAMRSGRSSAGGVVLLDLMMPVLDGAGVLRAVAGDKDLADAYAFVLVTAAASTITPALRELLARLGVPVVHKPFDLEGLLAIVERAAARLRATR